jgi:O-acetyl-ADP-ribose deacetylase (regulator of RNase III)
MVKIIKGNLLTADTQYIAHQCNCLTNRAAHLSKAMFDEFPHADVYSSRDRKTHWTESRDKPGTIDVRGNGEEKRYVINMFGQVFPGKPKFPDSKADGFEARRSHFNKCLEELAKIEDLQSVGFPYGIGCGAAGGDWNKYIEMIEEFADENEVEVTIYKLD